MIHSKIAAFASVVFAFSALTLLVGLVSDIAIFVLKRDVKLQLTNSWLGGRKGIRPVQNIGDDGGGHCIVRM